MNAKADSLASAGPEATCIVCGYDLRAQPPQGKCPECGTDVERSLHGDWLRFAERSWVRTVSRGLAWTWWGVFILVLAITLATGTLLVGLVLTAAVGFELPDATLGVLTSLVGLVTIGDLLVISLGLWWLTAPEPRTAAEPLRPLLLRTLTSVALPVIFLGSALAQWWTLTLAWPAWVLNITDALAALLIGAQVWLLIEHLRQIERRCRGFEPARDRLLKKYRRQTVGVAISMVILSVGMFLIIGRSFGIGLLYLAWIAALGLTGETRKRIRLELAVSPGTEHGGQPP